MIKDNEGNTGFDNDFEKRWAPDLNSDSSRKNYVFKPYQPPKIFHRRTTLDSAPSLIVNSNKRES